MCGSACGYNLGDMVRRKKMSKTFLACSACACHTCLYYWSKRCTYGECWDDYRAKYDPYPAHHMGDAPRALWSDWDMPGEQRHWCRGGFFFPDNQCGHYAKYEPDKHVIRPCLSSNVEVYQDGYIGCSVITIHGCRWCYDRFIKLANEEVEQCGRQAVSLCGQG